MDIVNINLLPWRYEKKKLAYKRKVIYAGLIFISLSLIIMMIHIFIVQCTQSQTKSSMKLEKRRNVLNKTLIHLKHKKILHQLYSNKMLTTAVLNQLIPSLPFNVVITRIVNHQNKISLYCSSGLEQLRHIIGNDASLELLDEVAPCGKKECKLRVIMKHKTACQRV